MSAVGRKQSLTAPQRTSVLLNPEPANRYAVIWRVQTAKRPETRARRIETLVAMLERGDKIHP